MDIEKILIEDYISTWGCQCLCKHGYHEQGYPECDVGWCDNHVDFELDIDKFKKEFEVEEYTRY